MRYHFAEKRIIPTVIIIGREFHEITNISEEYIINEFDIELHEGKTKKILLEHGLHPNRKPTSGVFCHSDFADSNYWNTREFDKDYIGDISHMLRCWNINSIYFMPNTSHFDFNRKPSKITDILPDLTDDFTNQITNKVATSLQPQSDLWLKELLETPEQKEEILKSVKMYALGSPRSRKLSNTEGIEEKEIGSISLPNYKDIANYKLQLARMTLEMGGDTLINLSERFFRDRYAEKVTATAVVLKMND